MSTIFFSFYLATDNLADHYKLRGGVYFVDALPMTASGKILRRQVREMLIATINGKDKLLA